MTDRTAAPHFVDDPTQPMHSVWWHAVRQPWRYLDQGWPLAHTPAWWGRGLAVELGSRAFGSLR